MSHPALPLALGGQPGRARATRALTAELGAPPVQGQPPGVGTLAGVLGEGVAEAAGAGRRPGSPGSACVSPLLGAHLYS